MNEQARQAETRQTRQTALAVFRGAEPLLSGKTENLKKFLKA